MNIQAWWRSPCREVIRHLRRSQRMVRPARLAASHGVTPKNMGCAVVGFHQLCHVHTTASLRKRNTSCYTLKVLYSMGQGAFHQHYPVNADAMCPRYLIVAQIRAAAMLRGALM